MPVLPARHEHPRQREGVTSPHHCSRSGELTKHRSSPPQPLSVTRLHGLHKVSLRHASLAGLLPHTGLQASIKRSCGEWPHRSSVVGVPGRGSREFVQLLLSWWLLCVQPARDLRRIRSRPCVCSSSIIRWFPTS
jgi:hypothetical protein